jgi:hypothetical protein
MNTSPSEIHLRIKAADDLSEIFLADSHFQLIANGVGVLDARVPPGIYKARFRAGQQQEDQLIEVPAQPAFRVVQGPTVDLHTPLPLEHSLGLDPRQQQAALEHSHLVKAQVGSGSWLYLFFRGLTKEAARPWTGLSLHDLSGKLLVKASQGVCDARLHFWALNVEVDPGTYRLRLRVEKGQVYEFFLVTLSGWQTQCFALSESAWLPGITVYRAALATASVRMVEAGKGFDPADPALRQTELLRLGLLNKRKILTQASLNTLAQAQDPLTILFALHMLRDQEEHQAWTEQLRARWQETLAPHPDFQALCLHQGENFSAEAPLWSQPPMLYASWQLLLQAITEKRGSFPTDSFNEQLHKRLVQTALWLLHRL